MIYTCKGASRALREDAVGALAIIIPASYKTLPRIFLLSDHFDQKLFSLLKAYSDCILYNFYNKYLYFVFERDILRDTQFFFA